jgi:hypothetical protein
MRVLILRSERKPARKTDGKGIGGDAALQFCAAHVDNRGHQDRIDGGVIRSNDRWTVRREQP